MPMDTDKGGGDRMDMPATEIVGRPADAAEYNGRIISGFLDHGCGDPDADRTLAAMLTIICRGMGAWDASSRDGRGRIVSMSRVITAIAWGIPVGDAHMVEPFSTEPGTWSFPDIVGGLVWMVTCHPRVFAPMADGMSRIAAMRPGVAMAEAAAGIRRLGDIDASDRDLIAWTLAGGRFHQDPGPVPVSDRWLRRLYDVEGMEAMACIRSIDMIDYDGRCDPGIIAMTAPEGYGWADIVTGVHDMAYRANARTHGLWPTVYRPPEIITWRLMDAYSRGLCPMLFISDIPYWDVPAAEDRYVEGALRSPDLDAVRRVARAGVEDGVDDMESAVMSGGTDVVAAACTLHGVLDIWHPFHVLHTASPEVLIEGMDLLESGMPEGFVRETILAETPQDDKDGAR